MSRRKLFEAAGTAAAAAAAASLTGAAAAATQKESEIIDDRLTRKVTLAVKATALSDLCEQLRSETGVQIIAGPSVADEKVTVFCEKLPLREVMRQLSRPFGFTWLRSRREGGDYRYELVQDLRSQLLEEELCNRDRSAALLAVEQEIERYRPYLQFSPDEALVRAQTAPPPERKLLEQLSGRGWGPIQMYFRLSPNNLEALRAGRTLKFSGSRWLDAQPLPAGMERGVLQSQRDRHLQKNGDDFAYREVTDPRGSALTAFSEARGLVTLTLQQSELGQFALDGQSGFLLVTSEMSELHGRGPYAVGVSPTVQRPDNRAANARLAHSAALRSPVTTQPQPSCHHTRAIGADAGNAPGPRVTTADALEALHHATGLPIVSDYYTRLYPPEAVSVKNQPLFEALNQLGDTMRLRWNKDNGWLQFRSPPRGHPVSTMTG